MRNQNYYALKIIPMLGKDILSPDIEVLKEYLIDVYNELYTISIDEKDSVARSDFGKVVCYFDKITYGWD